MIPSFRVKNVSSNIVVNDTYIANTEYKLCKVENNTAYLSVAVYTKSVNMSTGSYNLLTGLPAPQFGFQIQSNLFANDKNVSIRLYIGISGGLNWWYNPSINLTSGNSLSFHTSYLIK